MFGFICVSLPCSCFAGSAGVGVLMTEPSYVAPSLADLARDVTFPQNLPSIVCVHVLDPQPGDLVLDMCAAPGQSDLLLLSRHVDRHGGDISVTVFCLFLCPQDFGNVVTDISGVG